MIGVGAGGAGVVGLALVLLTQCLGGGGGGSLLPGADLLDQLGGATGQDVTEEPVAACGTTGSTRDVVCAVTTDVQDYWEAVFAGGESSYGRTQTVLFEQATQTGCGGASAQTGPFYCPLDRLVYFDLGFLEALQQQLGAEGDFAQAYIVAHEFGHHVQNELGINEALRQAQQQDPSAANELSVRLELQADCFAGAWAADAEARGALVITDADIDEALGAAEAVGDDRIQQSTQGRVSPESWTHGSAADRRRWFTTGLNTGDPNECNTFAEDAEIEGQ
jgi:predicted metalloprotease